MSSAKNPSKHLIVEGKDDQYAIIHLTEKHGIDWDKRPVQIVDANGCEEALKDFSVRIKSSERIGIVLDADLEFSNRWQAICNRLSKFAAENNESESLTVPQKPDPAGTIIKVGKRTVGIWLMPDNENTGKLEDFLKTLVPPTDCCWDYAGQAVETARSRGAKFSNLDRIKAHIHTWLAWQEEPGRPFGTAIKAAYFSHDTPEALSFVKWFKQLFEI